MWERKTAKKPGVQSGSRLLFLMLLDVICHFLPFWRVSVRKSGFAERFHAESHSRRCTASLRRFTGMGRVFIHRKRKTACRGCKRLILRYAYFQAQKSPAYTARHKEKPRRSGAVVISYSFCIAAREFRRENTV